MKNIFTSASKIAFLTLVLTACVAFMLDKLEGKDFMVLAMAASGYYFTREAGKSETNKVASVGQ